MGAPGSLCGVPTGVTGAEVLATSDVPAGVLHILTGDAVEVMPHLAAHGDVDVLDLTGADRELRDELERLAAEAVKHVYLPRGRPDFVWVGQRHAGHPWSDVPPGGRRESPHVTSIRHANPAGT